MPYNVPGIYGGFAGRISKPRGEGAAGDTAGLGERNPGAAEQLLQLPREHLPNAYDPVMCGWAFFIRSGV
jgi:hypothetical protein